MASRRDVLRYSAVGLGAIGLGVGPGSAKPGGRSQGAAGATHFAPLTHGESQNPDLVPTGATGFATFSLNDDGTLAYRVTARKVEDVVFAHIHGQAPRGETAGVVAFLFDFRPDLQDGPVDESGTVMDTGLVSAIVANPELYYVNLHTALNPAGEIRGQIRPRG